MKLIILLITIWATPFATASISKRYLLDSIDRAAKEVGVPADLLYGICQAESRLKPNEYVFSDGGIGNHAIGMCQVLVETAKELGLRDDRCHDDFRYRAAERNHSGCKLFGPYTNAKAAARYLLRQINRYNGDLNKAIAAYNTGSFMICKTGWVHTTRRLPNGKLHRTRLYKCIVGKPLNQRYIDRVNSYRKEYHEQHNQHQQEQITPYTSQPSSGHSKGF